MTVATDGWLGNVIESQVCVRRVSLVVDALRVFRAGLVRHVGNGRALLMGDQANADGMCFKWFDSRSFPAVPPLVAAASAALGNSLA